MQFARRALPIALAASALSVPAAHGLAQEAGAAASTLNPMHAVARSSLDAFVKKPLFDPSRRLPPLPPPAAAPPPPPAVAEPPPAVTLLGIVEGRTDLAIVKVNGAQATQMLSSGDHIGGWEVTVLPSLGLRLRNGDRLVEIALYRKAPSGVTQVP